MIRINEKEKCCGCTACANICPKQCIEMLPDEEGFLYPVIDKDKCINCGMCEKMCPANNRQADNYSFDLAGYVIRSKSNENLNNCSSGGVVQSVITYLNLHEGYYVCGAMFDEKFDVIHAIANSEVELHAFAGSKYVQSNLGRCFEKIKKLLGRGEKVCFVGTACQIDGLTNYLGKCYKNIFLISLVCHGVSSPMLWKSYKELQESAYDSKIVGVNFRDKSLGYQMPAMKIRFQNGKEYKATGRTDIMLKAFFSHVSLRDSCFYCPSKGLDRYTDLTVFDCWNSKELIGRDDNRGYTAVIVHTIKGNNLMCSLGDMCSCYKVEVKRLLPSNGGGMVLNSAKYNSDRQKFYTLMNKLGLSAAFKEVLPLNWKDYGIEKVKKFFAKSYMLQLVSRFKRLAGRKRE